jgi:hypothetical protein
MRSGCPQFRLPDGWSDPVAACPSCGRELRVRYYLRGQGQDRMPRPFVPAHASALLPNPVTEDEATETETLAPARAEAVTSALDEFVEAWIGGDLADARRWARSLYSLTDGGNGRGRVLRRGSDAEREVRS